MGHRAVFLDRDGTLVEPSHYPSRPEQLRVYDGIGAALRTLRELGFLLVVVTNQSGIARGYFDEPQLETMHEHLRGLLRHDGVELDAIYHCPHHPDGVVKGLATRCDCRKPEPGMLTRAAAELDIDLARSWLVGDILDDVEAGNRCGCTTILVNLGTERIVPHPFRVPRFVCASTRDALDVIVRVERANSRTVDAEAMPVEEVDAIA